LASSTVVRSAVRSAARSVVVVESLEGRSYFSISFTSPFVFQVQPNDVGTLQSPVIGDFNKDGKMDLVVADATGAADPNATPGKFAFAAGRGNGTYQLGTAFSGGPFSGPAAAGDFNGDGNLDLIASNPGPPAPASPGNNVVALLGNGDGTFQAPVSFTVGSEPLSITVADFNGDGRADFAVGNRSDNTVSVRLGATSGIFGPATTISGFNDPASIVSGDFNGDGKIDLVVGNANPSQAAGSLSFLAGNGDGTFANAVSTAGPRGATGVGDFNGDSKLDLAVSVSDQGVPTVLAGNGDGTFQVGTVPEGGFIALVGDYDGDGKLDIAAAGTSDNQVKVSMGNGNGTFAPPANFPADQPGAGSVGDIDGDGKPDLVLTGLSNTGRVIDTLLNTSGTGNNGTGDLTVQIVSKLPTAVVGGAKGKLSAKVANASGASPVTGPVSISLYASSDQSFSGDDTLLTNVSKKLKLKGGKSKKVNFKFNYPTSLPDGNYSLLAVVDSSNSISESNENNNTGVSPTPVTIAAPFIDLSGAFTSSIPSALTVGAKQTVTLALQNAGNVPAKGPLTVNLVTSADATGSGGTPVGSISKNINLKAGGKQNLKIKYTIAQGTAGNVFLVGIIDSGGSFTESNKNNNILASATPIAIS
jgi:hypothetical protein